MAEDRFGAHMMDEDPERDLLYSLVKQGKQKSDEWESSSLQYLKQLASSSLENLSHEPERLKEEKEQLLERTQNLAFENYQTFIQAAECSKRIYKDFKVVEDSVHDLLKNVPALGAHVENFQQCSQDISLNRRQNSLVLSRHTQLLEILEIPQLMDTCVRNGYYEEALELSNYVKRLGKKLSSINIICSICKEVKSSTNVMLKQLLRQLRTSIQLPACLRIIGYLRQLEVFTEAELRVQFLQARDSWFQTILEAIPTNDGYQHITKVIEASRVHLFDIITQYRAIFSDDDPIAVHKEDEGINYSHLLRAWVARKLSSFLNTLEKDLHHGTLGRLDSVLGQCMYFGLSFSRVGADFRGLLVPIFHRAVVRATRDKLEAASKRFEEAMSTFTPVLTSRTLHQRLSGLSFKNKLSGDENLSPPQELLDIPPLAHYTNAILTVLNDLRQYPALSIAWEVRKHYKVSLSRVVHSLAAWSRVELQSQGKGEQDQIQRICDLVGKELLPYLVRCFEAVYPFPRLSRIFGPRKKTDKSSDSDDVGLNVHTLVSGLTEFMSADEDLPSRVESSDESSLKAIVSDRHSEEPSEGCNEEHPARHELNDQSILESPLRSDMVKHPDETVTVELSDESSKLANKDNHSKGNNFHDSNSVEQIEAIS